MTSTFSLSHGSVLEQARRVAFRPVRILVTAFVAVSAAMLVFLAGVTTGGAGIDMAIWIRCSLVLASSIALLLLVVAAAQGSRGAWVRLRFVCPLVVAAVIVIVSIPGFLPDWVRIEQAGCGALLVPVAILSNLPRIKAFFPARAS